MSRKTDRRQARVESQLRYEPERDALRSILKGLKSSQRQDVVQARRAAYMLEASARSGIPVLKRVYNQAARNSRSQMAASQADLSKLGPGADAYKAAIAFSKSLPTGQSKAAAINELVSRAAAAPEQRVAEVRAIRGQYAGERSKVIDQLTSNRRQAGLYSAERFGELRGEARKTRNENRQKAKDRRTTLKSKRLSNRQSERDSLRSAGINPDTGKPIPGGKLDPKASKDKKKQKLTQNLVNTALDGITSSRDMYQQASGQKGFNEQGLRSGLLVGSVPLANGKSLKLPKVGSDLQITAGFELAKTGHLTRPTYRQLRARGIRVPKGWRPLTPTTGGRPETAGNPNVGR